MGVVRRDRPGLWGMKQELRRIILQGGAATINMRPAELEATKSRTYMFEASVKVARRPQTLGRYSAVDRDTIHQTRPMTSRVEDLFRLS